MCLPSLRSASLSSVVTVLLLAACGEEPAVQPASEGGGSVVAEAEATAAAIRAQTAGAPDEPEVAALAAGVVETTSAGGPKRSDGLWEMVSYTEDGSPMASQSLCVGAGSEEKFSVWDQLLFVGGCTRKDLTRAGDGWAFDTRCELMDMVNESKGTISGDFRTLFRVDQTIVTDGSAKTGSIRGENKGPCPAPFKPGDLISDGQVLMNMLQ